MSGGLPGGRERGAAPSRTPDVTHRKTTRSLPGSLLVFILRLEHHAVQDTSLSDIALCMAIFAIIYTILWAFPWPDDHGRSERRTTRRRRFERGSPKLFIPKLPRFKGRSTSMSMSRSCRPDLGSLEVISSKDMSAKDMQPSMSPTPWDWSRNSYTRGHTTLKEAYLRTIMQIDGNDDIDSDDDSDEEQQVDQHGGTSSPAKPLAGSGTITSGLSSPHSPAKLSRRSPGVKRRYGYYDLRGFGFHWYWDDKVH